MLFSRAFLVIIWPILLSRFSHCSPKEVLFINSPPIDWCDMGDPYDRESFGGVYFEELEEILRISGLEEGSDYIFRCEADIQTAKARLLSGAPDEVFFIFSEWILFEEMKTHDFGHYRQDSISIIRQEEEQKSVFFVFDAYVWGFLFVMPFFAG
jgi:hypothetical protein